jgi:hypothetical protein
MKRSHIAFIFGSAMALTSLTRALGAAPSAGDEFFEKEVRPILAEHCLKCHGGDKTRGSLKLTSRAALLQGGDTGPAAVPGKPNDSLLIQLVRRDDKTQMPKGKKLPDHDIAVLTRWVEMGLPYPVAAETLPAGFRITDEQRRFWAFARVKVVPAPPVKEAAWPRGDLDRYILNGLEAKGLNHAPAADKRTLLRRATFDLTGLPPTPEEVEEFLKDDSPGAFAKAIDRLLASPAYGERWGRHWLDLARYTDSFDARLAPGNEMDCGDAWRYRDWVIDAFNRDLPYDQFVREQIAGDLLSGKDGFNRSGIIATSFLALGNWGGGDADKDKLLTDIVDDQVDVTSRTFLGLTVGCARCHDHKFDPISQADYYALGGIFFSTHILPNVGPKTNGPPMLRVPLLAPTELGNEVGKYLARPDGQLNALALTPTPPVEYANGAQEGGVPGSPHAGVHDVRIHFRGRYDHLGELTPRRFPEILAGKDQKPRAFGSGRLQLAEWLTRPENPLTARVMANRIWQQHFGEGLVNTPSNFGKLGGRPSNPELLDYLADQFVRSGWSIKAMHRLIMLSATYQQSCENERANVDPENRLLYRMNRRRLEAEDLRDSLLATAGRLDRNMEGPSIRDFNVPRRTVYLTTIRSDRSGFRPLFDVADSTAPVDKRTVSTVAPQALFLMNNPFIMEQTAALAKRIIQGDQDGRARIQKAYNLLYGRPPKEEEVQIGLDFLQRGGGDLNRAWQEYCQVLLCANEFIYVD